MAQLTAGIRCTESCAAPSSFLPCLCRYGGGDEVSVTRSQQAFIATIPDGQGGVTLLEIGDRWGQSPDGLKGHEVRKKKGPCCHTAWCPSVQYDLLCPPASTPLAPNLSLSYFHRSLNTCTHSNGTPMAPSTTSCGMTRSRSLSRWLRRRCQPACHGQCSFLTYVQ
jgi:hypothetical protein